MPKIDIDGRKTTFTHQTIVKTSYIVKNIRIDWNIDWKISATMNDYCFQNAGIILVNKFMLDVALYTYFYI